MSERECELFGKNLAFYTAPTLLGIKCASLISFASDSIELEPQSEVFNRRASAKGLKSSILCKCGRRTLMLVYNEKMLREKLCGREAGELLQKCGYTDTSDVDGCIAVLANRLKGCVDFPHEIGIFLDYPIEDVVGFIENKGENFKLCGCWKVYGSEEKAKKIFSNYEKCRNFLCGKLNEGADIYRALKIS